MAKSLVSNPPYNLAWMPPVFAQMQARFIYGVPPRNNANYAFVLTALEMIDEKAALLLPNSAFTSTAKEETGIRRALIEENVLDAVIALPDGMFESTSIPTCVMLLNKRKNTRTVEMVDLRGRYQEEIRDQRGQYGGASHNGRVYHKTVKTLTDDTIKEACGWIERRESVPGLCRSIGPEELLSGECLLSPSRWIEAQAVEHKHRPYSDIIADYNRVIDAKNAVKLTINETLAKSIGIYDAFVQERPDLNATFAIVGKKANKEDYIRFTKSAEYRIETKTGGRLPEILLLFTNMWKQRIMMLNNEENRILAELRDAMLPELMNGTLSVSGDDAEGE